MPEQMEQHRQHHERVAHRRRSLHQGPRNGEIAEEFGGQAGPQHSGVPVSRQPPQVGRQHGIQHTYAQVIPTGRNAHLFRSSEQLGVGLGYPFIGPNVDDHNRAVGPAYVVVGHMMPTIRPPEAERLGGRADNVRVSVQCHQLIPLNPRLVANVPACSREPPRAWEVPLTTKRREPPYGIAVEIESNRVRQLQRKSRLARVLDHLEHRLTTIIDHGTAGQHRHALTVPGVSDQVRQTRRCIRSNETASDQLRLDTRIG